MRMRRWLAEVIGYDQIELQEVSEQVLLSSLPWLLLLRMMCWEHGCGDDIFRCGHMHHTPH
eukprot:COSAG01_NODE_33363_length_565_cov_1.214592_2_plen_61_part_00